VNLEYFIFQLKEIKREALSTIPPLAAATMIMVWIFLIMFWLESYGYRLDNVEFLQPYI